MSLEGAQQHTEIAPSEPPNGLPGHPQGAQNPDAFGIPTWLHVNKALRASWKGSQAEKNKFGGGPKSSPRGVLEPLSRSYDEISAKKGPKEGPKRAPRGHKIPSDFECAER